MKRYLSPLLRKVFGPEKPMDAQATMTRDDTDVLARGPHDKNGVDEHADPSLRLSAAVTAHERAGAAERAAYSERIGAAAVAIDDLLKRMGNRDDAHG